MSLFSMWPVGDNPSYLFTAGCDNALPSSSSVSPMEYSSSKSRGSIRADDGELVCPPLMLGVATADGSVEWVRVDTVLFFFFVCGAILSARLME